MRYLEGTREDLSDVLRTQQDTSELPPHPTLVFINPKSGGQMGQALLKLFGEVVGVVQVSLVQLELLAPVIHTMIYHGIELMLSESHEHTANMG